MRGMGIPAVTIVRPGLLARGAKARFVEKLGGWFMNACAVRDVARGMVLCAEQPTARGLVGGNGTLQAMSKQLVDYVPAAAAATAPAAAAAPAPAPAAAASGAPAGGGSGGAASGTPAADAPPSSL